MCELIPLGPGSAAIPCIGISVWTKAVLHLIACVSRQQRLWLYGRHADSLCDCFAAPGLGRRRCSSWSVKRVEDVLLGLARQICSSRDPDCQHAQQACSRHCRKSGLGIYCCQPHCHSCHPCVCTERLLIRGCSSVTTPAVPEMPSVHTVALVSRSVASPCKLALY